MDNQRKMDLREKAVKGVAWSAVDSWGAQVISIFFSVTLARLLGPEAFGLVAMASVFTSFFQMLMSQGMPQALIQRADLQQEHLDTVFWLNISTGTLLTASSMLLSGVIANWFSEPELQPIVAWLSLNLLIAALSDVQQAILRRRLDFKALAIRSLISRVVGGSVGVGTALCGFGAWSLVAQTLVEGLVQVMILWRVSDWRPGFHFSKAHFQELFAFSISILGKKMLNLLSQRLDKLLIGYFLGATMLGYYMVAQRLVRSVEGLLTETVAPVSFATYSRLQKEPDRLRRVFYQATQLTGLVAWPAFLGMAVIAPELVTTLFGDKWTPSIPAMQILTLAGLLQSILRFNETAVTALGKPAWILGARGLSIIVNTIGIIVTVQRGIVAVAAAYLVAIYVTAPLLLWMAHRLIRYKIRDYLNQYIVPVVGSLAMAMIVMGLKHTLQGRLQEGWDLGIYILTGILGYLGIVQLIRPLLLRQLLDFARLILPRISPRKA